MTSYLHAVHEPSAVRRFAMVVSRAAAAGHDL